jgi:redox-regulated HSP33 family molecular chaperone
VTDLIERLRVAVNSANANRLPAIARMLTEAAAALEAAREEVERLQSDTSFATAISSLRREKERADKLAEALREAKEKMLAQVKWVACDCGCEGEKPADAVSIAWLRASTLLRDQEECHEQ